jgi:hypothetical protein
MRNIFRSTLGKAATIAVIAGLAVTAIGATSAEARPWNNGGHNGWHNNGAQHWNGGQHWAHPTHWDHARWYGGGYYAPRYYAAPPVYAYPPAYYGPPSLNFNIPLG